MNRPPQTEIERAGLENLDLDVARYYYDQRAQIHQDAPMLRALMEAVNWLNDLTPAGWAQWYAVALGFKPDLILELGRGYGNSTTLFCQAASRLGRTRVVSLCNSAEWNEVTVPRLKPIVPRGWFDPLDARIVDILDVDYEQLFAGYERVLLLWDAHGFEIAETVLGRILPLIAGRPHLMLMHDISDSRYAAVSRSYEGQPLWKGSTWDKGMGVSRARVNIGWMNSLQDQVVAIADFAARNDLEVGSADHEFATFFGARPQHAAEMTQLLGDEFFSIAAHFAFLSLAGKQPPFHYPAVQRRFRHQCAAVIHDIHPKRWWRAPARMPRTIQTNPVIWDYAAVMDCRASEAIPASAAPSLLVRLQVVGAPVGVGLLSADGSRFGAAQRILPAIASNRVVLPIADRSVSSRLVLHTSDVPESARVRIEDVTFVW
jgi:hypothetical protein